jgi:hypothetical protein
VSVHEILANFESTLGNMACEIANKLELPWGQLVMTLDKVDRFSKYQIQFLMHNDLRRIQTDYYSFCL